MKRYLFFIFLLIGSLVSAQVESTEWVADTSAWTFPENPAAAPSLISHKIAEEPDTNAALILKLESERDSLNQLLNLSNASVVMMQDSAQTLYENLMKAQRRLDRVNRLKDSLVVNNERFQKELEDMNHLLEDKIKAIQEKEALVAEKEQLYRDALSSSTINKAQLEAEIAAKQASIDAKDHEIKFMQKGIDDKENSISDQKAAYERLSKEKELYRHLVDSLRNRCIEMDKENVRKQEENRYLAQRAREAEEKVATATNRKKKVRPIQGIAMRFYRTPEWTISLTPREENGNKVYDKQIWNRNAGNLEFDFITGASVMLWDLTNVLNKPDTARTILTDIRSFDQQFSYDLGLHVAFGGSNLFKNFYVGPSFRFMDFFYITMGVNVCEFEVLKEGIHNYDILDASQNMTDVICKKWLVKPFFSFSIDLDFLSYIKR